jgi:hypothetical protein
MEQELQVSPDAETQNPAPVDETPEVVAPESETPEAPDAPAEDPQAKSLKRLERRIDRVTAARYEAEARARQAEERLAQWEAQVRQSQGEEAPQQQVDPLALADQIATIREITAKSNTVAADGKKRFPDFSKALQTVAEEAGSLFTQQGRPTAIGEAVLAADDPAGLLHHLGTNPDIASELHGLSPIQAARKIARIELDLAKKPEPQISKAPKPLTPVKGTGADSQDPAAMTDAEFAAWRKRQIAQRG